MSFRDSASWQRVTLRAKELPEEDRGLSRDEIVERILTEENLTWSKRGPDYSQVVSAVRLKA